MRGQPAGHRRPLQQRQRRELGLQVLWGENAWTIFLQGGALNGILGDPAQTDNLYQMGFAGCRARVPFPSFGAYTGYSVALNTAYAAAALYGNAYRDLPITSYAWQIATTTGGPNAWWEANGCRADPDNPWQGSHAAPEFGAIPYAWPMAGQTQTLLQSLVAQGLVTTTNSGGSLSYHDALYIGRGIPDAWVVPGQTISVGNLTSSYDVGNGHRQTYGVAISVRGCPGRAAVARHADRRRARQRRPGPAARLRRRGRAGRGRRPLRRQHAHGHARHGPGPR